MSNYRDKDFKYKHSIRTQLSLLYILVLFGVIFICIMINQFFLSTTYQKHKIKLIKQVYTSILADATLDTFASDEFDSTMRELAMANNISACIVDNESNIVFYSDNNERDIEFHLLGFILNRNEEVDYADLIEDTSNYSLRIYENRDFEFLEMIGRLECGATFLMRTPIESINESAALANRFFAIVGIVVGLFGGVLVWALADRFTKPILRLDEISKRMVHLDFDAKYTGDDRNEIGMLGNNMNLLSDSLEEAISELKSANAELRRDIEIKTKIDDMRREFLSNVSHELKTPIAVIQGYAEGLVESVNDDPDSRNYYCEVIMDEAGKMNEIVKKLLTLNQLEFGKDLISMERFDVISLIQGYISSNQILTERNNINIVFDMPQHLSVWADRFLAEEVLANYFSNAIHYCIPKADDYGLIRISVFCQDGKAVIEVFNSGNLIPEDSLDRLWEKFYKVDKARTREYGGSGIGLSIVKAIQDSINEEYGVRNCEDGVVFWFTLSIN